MAQWTVECPPGFAEGLRSTCRVECPPEFIYTTNGFEQRCAYKKDPSLFFGLNAVYPGEDADAYRFIKWRAEREFRTIQDEFNRRQAELDRETRTADMLDAARMEKAAWGTQFASLEGDYSANEHLKEAATAVQRTTDALRVARPPTAPANDLEKERREISFELRQNMLLVQISLFLVVVSMLCYLLLPLGWAQGITFLLLCVGIATAFFLKR